MLNLEKPDKLYKVYSYVKNFRKLGEVCLEWVYHSREIPVLPYQEIIQSYINLNPKDREYACMRVDQMFTDQEMKVLSNHLEQVHKIECFSIQKPFPIDMMDMEDLSVAPRDLWRPGNIFELSNEPGYDLPFQVQAYCSVRRNSIKSNFSKSPGIGIERHRNVSVPFDMV